MCSPLSIDHADREIKNSFGQKNSQQFFQAKKEVNVKRKTEKKVTDNGKIWIEKGENGNLMVLEGY